MSACPSSAAAITSDLLLAVFDLPVTFHRCLVPITGGVAAALMLSHAIWMTQGLEPTDGGWFTVSPDEWTQELGLSLAEQASARRALRMAGFLEERRLGIPAMHWHRVRADAVWAALRAQAAPSRH